VATGDPNHKDVKLRINKDDDDVMKEIESISSGKGIAIPIFLFKLFNSRCTKCELIFEYQNVPQNNCQLLYFAITPAASRFLSVQC